MTHTTLRPWTFELFISIILHLCNYASPRSAFTCITGLPLISYFLTLWTPLLGSLISFSSSISTVSAMTPWKPWIHWFYIESSVPINLFKTSFIHSSIHKFQTCMRSIFLHFQVWFWALQCFWIKHAYTLIIYHLNTPAYLANIYWVSTICWILL